MKSCETSGIECQVISPHGENLKVELLQASDGDKVSFFPSFLLFSEHNSNNESLFSLIVMLLSHSFFSQFE